MARFNFAVSFSLRDAAVPGRVGAHQARPARQRKRRFQFERLEERLAMDGDSTLVADPTAEDAAVVALPGVSAANDVPSLPAESVAERFQSEAELEAWLIEAATAQYGHLFGQSTLYGIGYPYWYNIDVGRPTIWRANMMTNDAISSNLMLTGGTTASTTNVQVAGVDEADLVETDGEYLYILSGNQLVIVQAGVGDDLQVLSRVEIDGRPVGMYLDGDRLAIVSSSARYDDLRFHGLVADIAFYNYGLAEEKTTVTVLDVADRAAPTLVQKSEMDGRLVSSRVVDGELRLVLTDEFQLPALIAKPLSGGGTVSPVGDPSGTAIEGTVNDVGRLADSLLLGWNPSLPAVESVYETLEEYVARVKGEIVASATPSLRVLGGDGAVISESPLVEATDVYRPESNLGRSLTTIVTFDLSSNTAGPVDSKSVFTFGSVEVYATSESLYLFSGDWAPSGFETSIHKFEFSESHEISRAARGAVEGHLLNQFAADEHDGFLRVVVENSEWDGGQSVFVLEQTGKRLEVVGSVKGIAPAEQIYSVRFMGDRAFFVTFRKVDPLFAVDLSDPTDPKILGELKLPGYSDYLQPIDENHLLAIGRGANEQTGLFEELQVSIFNIADMSNPLLAHRYSFDGGRAIATPATGDRWQRGDGDHHAVSYFAESGIFALPIFNADAGWWWSGGPENSFLDPGESGLQVFQIDVTTGFTPIGLIKHETAIQRSVQIGEHLYAISSGRVSVHELTTPTVELGTVSIANISQVPDPGLPIFVNPIITTILPVLPIGPIVVGELELPIEAEELIEAERPIVAEVEVEAETITETEIDPELGSLATTTIVAAETTLMVTEPFPATDPSHLPNAPIFEMATTELAKESEAAEVATTMAQVLNPYLQQRGERAALTMRVQRLARFDAFDAFDNLLVVTESVDDLAVRIASQTASLTDVAIEDEGDKPRWADLGGALADESLEAELAI